jgi:hypothetical protein
MGDGCGLQLVKLLVNVDFGRSQRMGKRLPIEARPKTTSSLASSLAAALLVLPGDPTGGKWCGCGPDVRSRGAAPSRYFWRRRCSSRSRRRASSRC